MAETITPELEAVAKALFEREWIGDNGLVSTWEREPQTHDYWYASARAALLAIRNPTEGMLKAHSNYSQMIGYAEDGHKAMIDHILGSDSNG